MRTSSKVAAGLAALVLVGAWLPDDEAPAQPQQSGNEVAAPPPSAAPVTAATPAAPAPAPAPATPKPTPAKRQGAPLLTAAAGGDGDSWRDTTGREYRLGMVNAPEVGDCYGAQATDKRRSLTRKGFRAQVYAQDRYGRAVSVVTTADGTNVNVLLARQGFVDDRYLAQFRSENPPLAAALDKAFAAAKAERAGLWGACRNGTAANGFAAPPPAPAAASAGDCHPDYVTCIPVQGDGSGRGAANDLDCGDIGKPVQLRTPDVDPYRLDADGDGYGCDS